MASSPKMPVPSPSAGGGGIALVDAPCRPPPAPHGLDAQARRAWRELWSEPVAALSRPGEDRPLVLRLIALRERIAREGADAHRADVGCGKAARLGVQRSR